VIFHLINILESLIKRSEEPKMDMDSSGLVKWLCPIAQAPEKMLELAVRDTKVTFADNMDEPVHRWFRFPAGFSANLVRICLKIFNVKRGWLTLDPFAGSGTFNVVAKSMRIPSIGVELHPLLAWIANVKTYWEFDIRCLKSSISDIVSKAQNCLKFGELINYMNNVEHAPPLLQKCYTKEVLAKLYLIKSLVEDIDDEHIRDFHLLALLSTLRDASDVDVGWPYILPRKRGKKRAQEPLLAFERRLVMQYNDVLRMKEIIGNDAPDCHILEADVRNLTRYVDEESVSFAFTSPPYLNNYDYADRTRLELYFLGWASSWRDITEKIRKKLITSCSHQAKEKGLREGLRPREELPDEIKEGLIKRAELLRKIKYERGGRKDYDIMIVAYFNEMYEAMREICAVMRPGSFFVMILGDSAPYGVHVPTDEYLGEIGLAVGFTSYKLYVLRERGNKWQYLVKRGRKHGVKLRETLVLFRR